MLNNRTVRDILHKEYYLSEGRLYKVGDRLQLTAWEDEEKKELLSQLLEVSTLVHDKVVSQNILIPYKKALKKINNVSKQIHMNNKAEFYNITEFELDRKSTRLNSSHVRISYAVFCLKKKKKKH